MEGEELVELLKLHDSVYEQANSWFTSLKDNMKSQILSHFGHLPSKDPDPQVWKHLCRLVSWIFNTDFQIYGGSLLIKAVLIVLNCMLSAKTVLFMLFKWEKKKKKTQFHSYLT